MKLKQLFAISCLGLTLQVQAAPFIRLGELNVKLCQHGVLLLDVSCVIGADDLPALVHQRAAAVSARNRGVVFPHG